MWNRPGFGRPTRFPLSVKKNATVVMLLVMPVAMASKGDTRS